MFHYKLICVKSERRHTSGLHRKTKKNSIHDFNIKITSDEEKK